MIETEIQILINRKSDFDQIRDKIIDSKIEFPVYIFEFENHYELKFTSDYEEWELDALILECFTNYEFTQGLEKGRKEIRLQISRYQSELSTDNWGRRIENPINETKYLIKKSKEKPEKFNPKIKVLFENTEQDYYINIVNGINKTTKEKGFLLLDEFRSKNNESEILKNTLYKSIEEAVVFGYYNMQNLVSDDFNEYIKEKKKELKKQHRIPRKIVREFINSCNKFDINEIFKNIDQSIIFEKKVNRQTKLKLEGVKELEEYLKSPNQEFCNRNLKIRSSWDVNLPNISIGVKYFPVLDKSKKSTENTQKFRQIKFVVKENKIMNIIEEE